jgi:hypothetical protein
MYTIRFGAFCQGLKVSQVRNKYKVQSTKYEGQRTKDENGRVSGPRW